MSDRGRRVLEVVVLGLFEAVRRGTDSAQAGDQALAYRAVFGLVLLHTGGRSCILATKTLRAIFVLRNTRHFSNSPRARSKAATATASRW